MSNFIGVIIEESLGDKSVLGGAKIVKTEVEPATEKHKTPWLTRWTLHTVEIPEDNVQEVAEKISKALDSQHAWYADFKNDTHHYIIFRNKVFFVDRTNKKQYDEAKQYGISLGIPEYQLINYQGVSLDVLANFLNEANKNTYANANVSKAASSRLESDDYEFEKDEFLYHDTYFGSRDFIGEEIVYKDKKPVWGANYFGLILNDTVHEDDLYKFLRQALMQEYESLIPVRGPEDFRSGEWSYHFKASGDLSNFTGQEEISLNGKTIYRLLIHGGFIR